MPRGNFMLNKRSTNRNQKPKSAPVSDPQPSTSGEEQKESGSKERLKTVSAMFTPNVQWAPNVYTAFKVLLSLRIAVAIWSPIGDCDEVYNYWEPLHLLLYGRGFQTWEYSPVYGLRSYLYVGFYYFPAKLFQTFLPDARVQTFYFVRCFMALTSTTTDVLFYSTVCQRVSNNVGRLYLFMRALGPGAFISTAAFLPSSFVESATMLAMTMWFRDQWFVSIMAVAVGSLVGWPFAAVLGAPIAVDMIFARKLWKKFIFYTLIAGFSVVSALFIVDSYFYGKPTLAPLNIVIYNVFSGHGPTLYGVEPVSYYLINLLLNWNLAFPAAALSLPISITVIWICFKFREWPKYAPLVLMQICMWLWAAIFFYQPHKEERFMFPIYFLICVAAALTVDGLQRLAGVFCRNYIKNKKLHVLCNFFVVVFVFLFACASLSRIAAVYRNYYAPFDVYMALNERHTLDDETQIRRNLCLGKEWYRYPSSFFLPKNIRMNFVQSEFRGILPKPYDDSLEWPSITRTTPSHMNSMNLEEPSRYTPLDQCHYVVDLDLGEESTFEPNYSRMTDQWTILNSTRFLNSVRSNRLFRAFYVPFVSDRYCKFGSYNLLMKKKNI